MSATFLLAASLAAYAVSEVFYVWYAQRHKSRVGQAATACLVVALGIHWFALVVRSRTLHTVPYHDLWGSMSLLAWLLALLYLGLEARYRDRVVGAFLLPFVLILQAVMVLFASKSPAVFDPPFKGSLFALHVTSNIFAYAAFGFAFLLSSLFLIEQRFLRTRQWGRLFLLLPPLDVLERMSRTGIKLGLVALSIGLLTGFLSSWRLFGRVWSGDAKEVWSLLVLMVYAAYLLLQSQAGWRGSRASLLSVVAFGIVLFGYTVVNFFLTHYHTFY